jgi:hypothetical protein
MRRSDRVYVVGCKTTGTTKKGINGFRATTVAASIVVVRVVEHGKFQRTSSKIGSTASSKVDDFFDQRRPHKNEARVRLPLFLPGLVP